MRSAIRKSTIPPPSRNDKSVKLMARRKRSPATMNSSKMPKAMPHPLKITIRRRSFATPRKALMKIGMLPSGSVIRTSRIVADKKLYSTLLRQRRPHLLDHDVRGVIERKKRGFGIATRLIFELAVFKPTVANHQPMRHANQL